MPICRSCGAILTDRYAKYGICRNCFGTDDDPDRESR